MSNEIKINIDEIIKIIESNWDDEIITNLLGVLVLKQASEIKEIKELLNVKEVKELHPNIEGGNKKCCRGRV